MNYIFITYDAVLEFTSDRFFQSPEYEWSIKLCEILRGKSTDWSHREICAEFRKNGLFFFTKKINKKEGIIFDLSTFNGFDTDNYDRIITIFQKTLKYAVRYFEKLPATTCEKVVPKSSTTVVYPFPFTATMAGEKVLIDRNSSGQERKEKNFLTVFSMGIETGEKVLFTNLNKAISELENLKFIQSPENEEWTYSPHLQVTDLKKLNLSLDAKIGIDNWNYFLTNNQKKFIRSQVEGPERLEGAAGTGKTLSMILRCINILKSKIELHEEYHIIFVTHSIATRDRILEIFSCNWPQIDAYIEKDGSRPTISIAVTTLQEWSAEHLGTNGISEEEYLDKDASDSKALQVLYIEEAFENVKSEKWKAYSIICSDKFKNFIINTSKENLLEMLRQEIAVLIKGRAGGEIDKYKALTRPKYGIPIINDADKNFIFMIHNRYQASLEKVGQYDSDDIVLSALGHIKTPIWNRRRQREGYNACFIDETHLFNINELSVFHYINKPEYRNHIVFAIDKSQAIGDWGISDDQHTPFVTDTINPLEEHRFGTIFRSSPDIVNLAFNILSSGATLFTNFENPLEFSSFNFTEEDEKKSLFPSYELTDKEEDMIQRGIASAEEYCRNSDSRRSNVLLVATSDSLLNEIESYAKKHNKAFEILKSRSDIQAVRKAKNGNKFVIGGIDYVGGLEFDAVIILGVDKLRVPPKNNDERNDGAYHYMNYAWHNRMYVAVTRAKYALFIMGVQPYGVSPILESAINLKLIKCNEAQDQ